jgi:hypothetical protein
MTINMKASFAFIAIIAMAGEMRLPAETFESNPAARMGRYNVVWTNASKNAAGAMPIGNGDIAASVYAIENGDLYLLLSKNDAFNYCGDIYKTGRVRISLTPNPFTAGKPFRQTLDLPTGSMTVEADGVNFRIWADANRPLYHVEIDSPRELDVSAQPEFWKRTHQWGGIDSTPDVKLERDNHLLWYFSVGDNSFYPSEMKSEGITEQPEKLFPDPYRFNTFGNLMEMVTGKGIQNPESRIQNSEASKGFVSGKGKQFDIRIHSLTLQTPDTNVWIKAVEELAAKPVELKKDWEKHCQWWSQFWDRGWIIASDRTVPEAEREKFNGEANAKGLREEPDGAALVAQSYNFFRFAMAAQSRGRYQVKFNGGIFTQQYIWGLGEKKTFPPPAEPLPDGSWLSPVEYRAWGARFTFQNQRLLYWPLLMSGDFDLMKPFFDHYLRILEVRKETTRRHFGHAGVFYLENISPITGPAGLPPKTKPGEKYEGGYHNYYFTCGLETVAMMADYVNYTGDTAFRDEKLVPFAREILLFYDKHYERGADGKLRLDPAQALETWWITVNPAPEVAGLRFCLDQLLAMKAGTAEDRARWKKFRAEIPEVPMRMIRNRQAIAPAEEYQKKGNGENAEIYPMFPFRCYGLVLGSQDIAEWTMQHRYSPNTFGNACWVQDEIGWACAGNAKEASAGVERRFRTATDVLRFPIYGQHTTDGAPDWDHFGSGSIALQRMLVQEGGGKIHLLPAWPAEWDVDFKLHLEKGVELSGTVKEGKLQKWEIIPAARKVDVVVHEPVVVKAETKKAGEQ